MTSVKLSTTSLCCSICLKAYQNPPFSILGTFVLTSQRSPISDLCRRPQNPHQAWTRFTRKPLQPSPPLKSIQAYQQLKGSFSPRAEPSSRHQYAIVCTYSTRQPGATEEMCWNVKYMVQYEKTSSVTSHNLRPPTQLGRPGDRTAREFQQLCQTHLQGLLLRDDGLLFDQTPS